MTFIWLVNYVVDIWTSFGRKNSFPNLCQGMNCMAFDLFSFLLKWVIDFISSFILNIGFSPLILSERERKREQKRQRALPIYWFTLQMPVTSGAGLGQRYRESQDPGTETHVFHVRGRDSATWAIISCLPRGAFSHAENLKRKLGTPVRDAGVPSGILIARLNAHSYFYS